MSIFVILTSEIYQKTFFNKRIKEALKPFDKITDFKKIYSAKHNQNKEIQVTIIFMPYSKNLLNRWSISIGTVIARIAPFEDIKEL